MRMLTDETFLICQRALARFLDEWEKEYGTANLPAPDSVEHGLREAAMAIRDEVSPRTPRFLTRDES